MELSVNETQAQYVKQSSSLYSTEMDFLSRHFFKCKDYQNKNDFSHFTWKERRKLSKCVLHRVNQNKCDVLAVIPVSD